MPLMPWQRYVAHVALEVDPETGWWAYDHVVMTVPRRAGKSALTQAVKVHRLATVKRARLLMSAQNGMKALDRWNEVRELLETSELAPKVRSYTSVSHERIVWRSTLSKLVPIAPDGDNVHGDAVHLLSLDELWKYDAAMKLKMQAGYRPAFLTTNAQAWLFSTAGTQDSTWLNEVRAEGRASVERGENQGTCYFEWSMPDEIAGVPWREIRDLDLLVEAAIENHPAVGFHPHVPAERMRISIREDMLQLAKAGGAGAAVRAYGNLTGDSDVDRLIPAAVVAASTTLDTIPTEVEPGIAFDVDPDRRTATISAAWRDADGRALVEVIEHGLGTRWVAGAVVGILERQGISRVTANNAGPARDVADEIERAGITRPGEPSRFEVQRVSAMDYAAACVRVYDELKVTPRPTIQHNGAEDLVEAFRHTGRRNLGNSWAFDSTGEPITPVTSATLAVWAADHPPELEPPLPQPAVY
jgi:hypothetical protein